MVSAPSKEKNLYRKPPGNFGPPATTPRYPIVQNPVSSPREAAHKKGAGVTGRVIMVRQEPNEPMDFDPWRWLAIPVWGLCLFFLPFVGALAIWITRGPLPALIVGVFSLILLRFLFSNRLIQGWHLTAALNGRYIVEHMPVMMARVRSEGGREMQLRLKGHLVGGTLMEGDRIVVTGRVRQGVLHAKKISCQRTNCVITPKQPNAKALAVTGTLLFLGMLLWLGAIGVPWVKAQTQSETSTIQFPFRNPSNPGYHP